MEMVRGEILYEGAQGAPLCLVELADLPLEVRVLEKG
jgi:hypothetical protein